MVIVIDLTSLSWHLTGIERYAMGVTDKMIDIDEKNKYVLIFRNEVHQLFADRIDGKRISSEVLYGNNKLFFLQFTLMKALKKIKADKYIFFSFPGPLFFRSSGIVNTIHDMGAWDSADDMATLSKYYFRASYRHAVKVSERIITVSEFSKKRIQDILKVPEDRVEVINAAVYEKTLLSDVTPFEKVKKEYKLPDKYILTLSTLEPRKNMSLLLEAFDEVANMVDYDLVLVGRKGWKMDSVLEKYESQDRIHFTGFVKDEHLSSIYKNSLCFVFPSLYEGFGLPPVEALALGTPVISSDAASLPEVLMDQAVYFKNNSKINLEKCLLKLRNGANKMPCTLNETQQYQYNFRTSAEKVIKMIGMESR